MATRIIEVAGAIGAEPRRRFTDDDKARIVSEAMLPGASVVDVGRRHRVCPSLIYRWRRRLLRDGLAPEPAAHDGRILPSGFAQGCDGFFVAIGHHPASGCVVRPEGRLT